MANQPHSDSDSERDFDDREMPGPGWIRGQPRWVKVSAVIGLVVILLVVLALVFGGGPGEHGPGRHSGSSDSGDRAATVEQVEPGAQPDGHTPLAQRRR